jgi:Zn-dependent protease
LLPLFILFKDVSAGRGLEQIFFDILFIFAIFGCIVLHEIGHALAARGYGIGTRNITLYPVGGVASLERMPEKPGREVAIALAGPAVNLVIAAALFGGLLAGSALITADFEEIGPLEQFATALLEANLFLFVFNLLPAFPMDGGRVLRALLALRMTRLRATEIAVGVGTILSGVFLVVGLLRSEPGLMALAVVVYLLGQAELAMVRVREAGRGLRERLSGFFSPEEEPISAPSVPGGPPSPLFSGLAWDATRRVWVEWKNGIQVRPVASGR